MLSEARNNIVFGEGNPDAAVLLAGEAPGGNEDKEGSPFVGDAGKLLRSMIDAVGLRWEDLYVTNVVACRPPDNRDPTGDEKAACLPRLHEIIYTVDPILIVAIGKYALNSLVGGRSWGIEAEQGKLFSSPSPAFRVAGERNGAEIPGRFFPRKGPGKYTYRLEYDVVPILHPAYVLRMDSFDPKTETFSAGGPFYQSMDALESVVERLTGLKKKYDGIARILERM
jgi:uracil-DNA glycosylase family 4